MKIIHHIIFARGKYLINYICLSLLLIKKNVFLIKKKKKLQKTGLVLCEVCMYAIRNDVRNIIKFIY